MQVLDRYLDAVRGYLPRDQRADIVAELAEDLRSEIEARQAALGRPLAEDELRALLKRRGHPMSVAERYLPARHLIGPAMLPAYLRTVRIAVGVILVLALAGSLVFTGPARGAVPVLSGAWIWFWLAVGGSLAYVGLFTLIFGLVERHYRRAEATGRWDPRDPEGLTADVDASARLSQRAHAVADVVTDLLLLVLWLRVHPVAMPEMGIVLTPVWLALHWPVALYLIASIGVELADALRPSSSRGRLLAHLWVDGLALALIGVLLAAAPWVRVTAPSIPAETARLLGRWMNSACLLGLLSIGVYYLVRFVRQALRAFGGSSPATTPQAAGR